MRIVWFPIILPINIVLMPSFHTVSLKFGVTWPQIKEFYQETDKMLPASAFFQHLHLFPFRKKVLLVLRLLFESIVLNKVKNFENNLAAFTDWR